MVREREREEESVEREILDFSFFFDQVLQTGQEIMELDHCGFNTQSATICVGNLAGSKYILQVRER